MRAVLLSIASIEADQLIPEHVAGDGDEILLHDLSE
jgi:hypothetical protein